MVTREDIEIRFSRCEECEDNPLEIQGYYDGELYYGHDCHDECDENEIIAIVKDTVLDMVTDEQEHRQAQD